ncbi:MAG: hypothetical protein Q7J69_03705 [Candidatus Omnitrophota bacterium]|nr:hypothetical protein [Candidatus Omnitrophota bacterium]
MLIAGQLGWGLPAYASDTLRTGQEEETRAAGLAQAITAGMEEPRTVIRLVPIRDYPPVQTDPAVLARLPTGAPREVYEAYVRWLNGNSLRPPSHNQLIRSMNKRHPSELTSVLDLVERAAAESALPVFVLSHGAEEEDRFQVRPIPDPRDFLAAYLAYLTQNQARLPEATVPIPADWSWPHLADTLTKNQALQRDDPRMTRLIQGVLSAAQGSQSEQNLPAVLVEVSDSPRLNIKVYQAILDELAPTHSVSKLLRAYVDALNANRGIPPAISDVLTRSDLSLASADSVFREANQRIQEAKALPIFLRPRWLEPDSNLAKFLAAYLSRRSENLWVEQVHLEIPAPKGWGLARLFELAERYPDHLAPFAEIDPEGLGQLLERIRKTGRSVLPGPHFTEPQLKLIGVHSALIRHPVEGRTLPTKKALADALEIRLSQVTETVDQIRSSFGGNRSVRIFPIRLANDLSTEELLEYWMRAYAADHSGKPLEFNVGRLLVAYNAFVRLSGPAERRPVSWEVLARDISTDIAEARRRIRELDRLFEYVGLLLTMPAGPNGQLSLSDGTPRFQPIPTEGNPIERELRALSREIVTQPGDEAVFQEVAWEELLRREARLPGQPAPRVSIVLSSVTAGMEEKIILLIGADPDGRIEGIIRDVFPAADIQPRALPLPSKVQFRGIDIAVLSEFDGAVKETLAQAFRAGTISHVIAPDHFEDELETYPLREALQGFRDAAGLEENWPEKMKEILRPVWGERLDQLTHEDLRTLRFAGTLDALVKLLDAYGAALGFENLPPGYFSTTAMRLFAEGWLYPEPMQQPSPELFIAYAERMPSSIGNEFYRAIRAPTAEEFLEKIARAQQAIEDYLRDAPEDDLWRFRLSPLVESDYTDREKELLLQTAQRIVAALFPSEAAAERDARARDWVAKTRPPHLKEVLSQLEQLGVPFSPEVNGDYKRSFMALTSFIIRYPTFASKDGAGRITVSRGRSGNEPVFVGNAAHEFIHLGISQLPELVGRAESLWISSEDWFTASTESIMTRWVSEETQTPPLYPAAATGPALVEWLHRRGTEIARDPTDQWVPQISELMRHLPPGLVPYAVGRAIGGIAEQLGQEAAAAASTLNRHEAALSFILDALIRKGQGPFDLKNLGPEARKFRAAHNLPEEFSAGMEENALREQWHGMRSATQGDAVVVIGPSVSDQFGGLEELARLDGDRRIFLDQGAGTALHMLEAGIKEARYYGGLEEASAFQRMVAGTVSVSRHAPTEGPFLAQVEAVLRLAGVPEPMIRAGLEEFSAQLDAVDVGA